MTSREKAIAELKRRMEEQKARLDPNLLRQAQDAFQRSTAAAPGEPPVSLETLLSRALPKEPPPRKIEDSFDGLTGLLPPRTANPPGSIPYNRTAARRAVELFLSHHRDRKNFELRLAEFIKKSS